jgi:hypothetical protein
MTKPDIGERLILNQLKDQQTQLRAIEERLRHIELGLGILKTKAAFIGAFFGMIPTLIYWMVNRG